MQYTQTTYADQSFDQEVVEGADLSKIKFIRCSFRWTDFTNIDTLFQCVFDSCDFTNARLNGVSAKSCAFLSCRFKNTGIFATTFEDCKMTGSDFTDSECGIATIIGGDWSYTNLRKQSFQKMDLSNTRFFGAELSKCSFNQCNLQYCDFREAIAHETSFYKSDLRHASLESFSILDASFRQAKLDLQQCVLIAETLTEGQYLPEPPKE